MIDVLAIIGVCLLAIFGIAQAEKALFGKRPHLLTFDDVASDECKIARSTIQEAAHKEFRQAVTYAQAGSYVLAQQSYERAGNLKRMAIWLPLDMKDAGL